MAVIRSDFAELSVSHQLLSERVTTLQARADAAYPDSPAGRGNSLASKFQLLELSSRLSSMESSRVSLDITISRIMASITEWPRTMVRRVFEALGVPELAVDVLNVCSRTAKNVSAAGDRQRRSAVLSCISS